VEFRASLADGLAGVRDFMRQYPYTCLEQQVSQAVALRDRERWRAVMAGLPACRPSRTPTGSSSTSRP
jgi:hypothetical protein